MTINWQPSMAEITASGYTKVEGTSSLFSHVSFPGLLFKRVLNLQEAIACGAVAYSNPNRAVVYVGRTARSAYNHDLLGSVLIPSVYKMGAGLDSFLWGSTNLTQEGAVVGALCTPTTFIATGIGLAAITKAYDGLLWDVRTVGGAFSHEFVDPAFFTYGGTPSEGQTVDGFVSAGSAGMSWAARLLTVGGFLTYQANVPVKDMLLAGRVGLLSSVDEDAREVYAQAFDEVCAAMTKEATITDQVKIFLQTDRTWATVNPVTYPWLTPPSAMFTHMRGVFRPINTAPYTGGRVSSRLVFANCDWSVGAKLPNCSFSIANDGPGGFAQSYLPGPWTRVGVSSDLTTSFNALSVVQRKAKLSAKQPSVPLSGIVASLLPLSAPSVAAADAVLEFDRTRAGMFEALDSVTYPPALTPVPGVTQEEITAKTQAMRVNNGRCEELRAFIRAYGSADAAAVDSALAAIDKRAVEIADS